jgi:probable rRNA maturation factor
MKKKAKKNMVMNSSSFNIILDDEAWKIKLEDFEKQANEILQVSLSFLVENDLGFEGWNNKPVLIGLSLSNNDEVQKLNYEFRGKNKPTNVLSFANIDDEVFEEDFLANDVVELGDIIMAIEILEDEASIKNISLKDHFSHLLVHGILHLFGYDHQDDDEADEMEGIEIDILKKVGIADPYEE